MRKLFVGLTCALLLGASCSKYDDTDLKNRVEDLEERVAALEELCQQLNTNIASVQTLLEALENNDYITGINEITENGQVLGYTITFAKGAPITIYHGQEGKIPVIGVSQDTDGAWYWTLDGEWLTDDAGKQIPATSEPGADGITPQLKIEDGKWYVSYDGEQNWTELGPATGDQGEPGDAFFQSVDTTNSDYVIFTLADGTELKLPRHSQLAIEFETEGPIVLERNATQQLGYTITGNLTEDLIVEAVASDDIKVKIEKTSATTGQVVITTGWKIDEEYAQIVVLVSEGNNTIVKNLAIEVAPMFPDPIFQAYVLANFDTDQDGKISEEEAAAVTQIDVSNFANEKIASLQGVAYFANLEVLDCRYQDLDFLDVSQNTKLSSLQADGNRLTSLDVSHNQELTWLECAVNELTTIDVSHNPELDVLQCDWNQLTTIDVTQNPKLRSLSCSFCQLTTLDVSQNPKLRSFYCFANQLTMLDVRQNPELEELNCNGNQLTALDLSNNTRLEYLSCELNQLTELDLSKTNLENSRYNKDGNIIYPLWCSPMETLQKVYLKNGWSIKGVTEDRDRSNEYIPDHTEIEFVD